MKRLTLAAAVVGALALGGCTLLQSPSQGAKTTLVEAFADSCHAYATGLRTAAELLNENLLTQPQIDGVDKAKAAGDAVCNGPQPTNYAAAWVSVTEALAELATATGGK